MIMEFFAKNSSFASFKYSAYQPHAFGFSTHIEIAIRAFQDGKLTSAGNQFLDIYQAVQNTQQDILSTCISENSSVLSSALRIKALRGLEPPLVRDAAVSFYFANSNAEGSEKKICANWPKIGSGLNYRDVYYKEGTSINTILKHINLECPLDVLLSGSTSTRELAKRLSYYCRFLVKVLDGEDGEYLAATECIIGQSLPSDKRLGAFEAALELSKEETEMDTNESKWIRDCITVLKIKL